MHTYIYINIHLFDSQHNVYRSSLYLCSPRRAAEADVKYEKYRVWCGCFVTFNVFEVCTVHFSCSFLYHECLNKLM